MNSPQAPVESLAPSMALVATGLAGTPLAVLVVSLLNRTAFKAQPLTVEEAVAIGGAGSALLGYAFHIAKVLIDRKILAS